MSITEYMQDNLPLRAYETARANRIIAHRVAHQLIESKSANLLTGKANRYIMSILGKVTSISISSKSYKNFSESKRR